MELGSVRVLNCNRDENKIMNNLEEVYNCLSAGVCISSGSGEIIYVNESFTKMFREGKSFIIGKNLFSEFRDEVTIKTLRTCKKNEGFLKYFIGADQIYSTSEPIWIGNEFTGAITFYTVVKKDGANIQYERKSHLKNPFDEIIGNNPILIEQLTMAKRAAKVDSTVLILGESGTGKELVANVIHKHSKREKEPFIVVNCGAIPSALIESELFGHEAGAFTGAKSTKIGKFEAADGGTIFLDEIGELPLDMQVKFLRVLQNMEFSRIGGNENIKVDVRIIAATNKDLEHLVKEDQFRGDLYYRLNVIPIELPSLKERKNDITLLIEHFLKKIAEKMDMTDVKISEDALGCLIQYSWPGNIRELENIIELMLVMCENDCIDYMDVPGKIRNEFDFRKLYNNSGHLINVNAMGELASMEEYERHIIAMAMKKYKSFNAAGKVLGMTHKTVAAKVRKYNLEDCYL